MLGGVPVTVGVGVDVWVAVAVGFGVAGGRARVDAHVVQPPAPIETAAVEPHAPAEADALPGQRRQVQAAGDVPVAVGDERLLGRRADCRRPLSIVPV